MKVLTLYKKSRRLDRNCLFIISPPGCWNLSGRLLESEARAEGKPEPKAKAAFLFSFPKYVEWPQGSFASSNDEIANRRDRSRRNCSVARSTSAIVATR